MKIPENCAVSVAQNEQGVMTLLGSFKITTQADVDQMVEAMQAMGAVLAAKKPRKKKNASSTRNTGAARAA